MCYACGLFVDKQHRLEFSKNQAFNLFFNCSYVESAWYEPQYVVRYALRHWNTEKRAWLGFISLFKNFLGNKRSSNYVEVVNEFLEAYEEMGCNMSIKIHFLHSHLEFSPNNLGQLRDERGELFHQEISTIEKRFAGKSQVRMLANYCSSLKRETDDSSHERKRTSKHF